VASWPLLNQRRIRLTVSAIFPRTSESRGNQGGKVEENRTEAEAPAGSRSFIGFSAVLRTISDISRMEKKKHFDINIRQEFAKKRARLFRPALQMAKLNFHSFLIPLPSPLFSLPFSASTLREARLSGKLCLRATSPATSPSIASVAAICRGARQMENDFKPSLRGRLNRVARQNQLSSLTRSALRSTFPTQSPSLGASPFVIARTRARATALFA